METKQQLTYLQEKVEEIGSAIFFNESQSVLKLPTALVSNIKVDEFGYLWFITQKASEENSAIEAGFPVRLDLYRKGVQFYMQIEGAAWVVSDPEEIFAMQHITEDIMQQQRTDTVLLKVKIVKAACYQIPERNSTPIWKNTFHFIYSLLPGNYQYRPRQSFFSAS